MGIQNSTPTASAKTPSSSITDTQPSKETPITSVEQQTKKLKPCCACPETKKARDECILNKSEEECRELIEAHKECMRQHGFKV